MQAEFRSFAVGVFDTAVLAEKCVEELRRAGFAADEIGIIEPDPDPASTTLADGNATGDARSSGVRRLGTAGAVIGGLLGAATALVIPGAGPVIAGGILATALGGATIGFTVVLAGFGMSAPRATFYERQLEQGRTIVTVNVAGRYQEATDILRAGGARAVDATGVGTKQYAAQGPTNSHDAS